VLIDGELHRITLSGQDPRFVTQLVFGVLRHRGALDALLTPFIRTPLHAVQDRVWDVLHLGAFQLVFLTHVPKHAAVHETVELATHIGSPQAKGFVNGVLRRVSELVTDVFTDRPGADTIPFDWEPKKPNLPSLHRNEGGEDPI
jgi:16S rRNA (cytosine967-C5)-methyltransferase